jgi:mRNA-degrading endonuclease toxin of MazEF toxin-antitoxin module
VQVAGEGTRVLVEQLRAVDLHRLDRRVGRLTPEEQRAVDAALELVLAL